MSEQIKIGDKIINANGQITKVLGIAEHNWFKIWEGDRIVITNPANWSLHEAKKELNWYTEETQDVLMNVESLYLAVCKYIQSCKNRNTRNYNRGIKLYPASYQEFIKRYDLENDKVPYNTFAFSNKNISRLAMNEFFNDLSNELHSNDLNKILK